ncbi:uncharacterized protein LOC114358336 [Ostrinia furnacalis]|uniref:uncharacterized protein LOC114358336 n=1 Tax=Ostrinia furnacalis TaxID=93504 RepID=UPI0010403ECA|nr:uncharacterized protein LOC114358336 [Ostrinia furnacalis]
MDINMEVLLSKLDEKLNKQTLAITTAVTANVMEVLENRLAPIIEENNNLKQKVANLEVKLNSIEKEKRKNNIIFFGSNEKDKNETELIDYIKETIQDSGTHLDSQEISNIYRIGKPSSKCRPVVVTLTTTWKKHLILKNKANLPSGIYVKEDYPKDVLITRKELQSKVDEEKKKGNVAYIKYDKLVVKHPYNSSKEKRKRDSKSPKLAPQKKQNTRNTEDSANTATTAPSKQICFFSIRHPKKQLTASTIRNRHIENKNYGFRKTPINNTPSRLVTVGKVDYYPPYTHFQHTARSSNELTTPIHTPPNRNQQLRLCTYNVRSLLSNERLLELSHALKKINYDIIGLSEVRKQGCTIEEHQDFILCYTGVSGGLHGVGFIIKKTFKQNIVNYTGISERVAVLKLRFGNHTLSIIQAYAPTEKASEEDLEKFYGDMRKAHESEEKTVIVMGDFNAKIGQPKKLENLVMDHRLLRSTFTLKSLKLNRKSFKPQSKAPESDTEKSTYMKNLKDNINKQLIALHIDNLQMYYDILENIIITSLQTIEINKKTKKKPTILRDTTVNLIKRRSELISTKNKDRSTKTELKNIFKVTNKAIKEDYNNHRQRTIEKNLNMYRSSKRAFKELNTQKVWIQKLKNEHGETTSRSDIIEHATAFYRELYKKPLEDAPEENPAIFEDTEEPVEVEPISTTDVFHHIKKLKTDKSPGPDNISNEAIKIGAPILIPYFAELFNMVLENGKAPKQWCCSNIVLLYKKGNPADIGNYRPISLLSSIYKLFTSIVLSRISAKIDNNQPIEQAGFRSGFSTIDHIHTLDQILEKYKEYNRPLYIAFIDYAKAFDSISHNSIWKALAMCGISRKYIEVIKYIYTQSTSIISLENKGEEITIERGVRQGDPLSPKLFIAVLEGIFKEIDWKEKGLKIQGHYLNHLRFADDIVLFAETANELEQMIQILDSKSKKVGLHMNINKTKIMTNHLRQQINVSGLCIEYVNEYIYLGKQLSFGTKNNEDEVDRRINCTWKKFWALKEILKGDYSIKLKQIMPFNMPYVSNGSGLDIFPDTVKEGGHKKQQNGWDQLVKENQVDHENDGQMTSSKLPAPTG